MATQHSTGTTAAGASPASVTSAAAGNRPNIIFINTDDLDMASLPTMPKLKSLMADQGTTCTNFFANVSLCCPSRSTFLRGQYASHTQVLTNGGNNGGYERAHAVGIENSTIATWLQAAGYHTGLIGKYLNGYGATKGGTPETYIPPGWSEWYGATGGNRLLRIRHKMNENGKIVKYGNTPQDYRRTWSPARRRISSRAPQGTRRPSSSTSRPKRRMAPRRPRRSTRTPSRTRKRPARPPTTSRM